MKKRKLKKKMIIPIILFIAFASIMIFSLIKIIKWNNYNSENTIIKNKTKEYIRTDSKNTPVIDFDSLKSINPDSIAHIKVNGTNIDYVVVKASDNEYYLKHNFNKKYNEAGWIFADYRNKFDGTDNNIVIFGHNTLDGSMFGTLKNILNKDWYTNRDNHIITLTTIDGTYKYQVFSTYMIEPETYYINPNIEDNELDDFIKTIKSRSFYDYKVDTKNESQILTLSTCINNATKRVVLHAIKIDNM